MTGPHYCMHDKNSRLYWLVFIDRSLNFTYNIAEVNGDSREGFGGNPSLLNEILGHRSEAQRSVQRWTKTTFTHADEKRVCNLPAALQQRQLGFDTYATFSLWCSSDSLPLSLWRSSNSLPWEQLIEQLLTLPLLLEVVLGPLLHQRFQVVGISLHPRQQVVQNVAARAAWQGDQVKKIFARKKQWRV